MVLSISRSRTVARLSVTTTESERKPMICPSLLCRWTWTRVTPDRALFEVIRAMIFCGNPVAKPAACTTKGGRFLYVCKSEFGHLTRITSPRLHVIICPHTGRIPVFGEIAKAQMCLQCFNRTPAQLFDTG